jgi:hypothetical protein
MSLQAGACYDAPWFATAYYLVWRRLNDTSLTAMPAYAGNVNSLKASNAVDVM